MKFTVLSSILFSLTLVSALPAPISEPETLMKRDDAPNTCDITQRITYINKGLRSQLHPAVLRTGMVFDYWAGQAWINFNVMESILNAYVLYGDEVVGTVDDSQKNMVKYALLNGIDTSLLEKLWGDSFGSFGTDDYGWRILMGLAANNYYQKYNKGDKWLKRSKKLFDSKLSGYWDTNTGGVFWKEKKSGYRATISTELYMTIAAKLYQADNSNTKYLDYAKQAYDYLYNFGIKSEDGLFGDGYNNGDDGKLSINNHEYYTYNQGVVLSGLGLLYNITKNETYLKSGLDLVGTVMLSSLASDLVLKDNCDQSTINDLVSKNKGTSSKISTCNEDRSYFKGAFMKHMTYFFELIPVSKSKPFYNFVQANANAAWGAALNSSSNAFNNVWIGQSEENYDDLPHKHDGAATAMAFDAIVASIKYGNTGYGCGK